MNPQQEKKTINPIHLFIGIIVIVFIILLLFVIKDLFHTNPYGDETRIEGFSGEIGKLPQDQRDLITSQLFSVISQNLSEAIDTPRSGAVIRDGTASYNYNSGTNVYYGEFIVDLDKFQQSYKVSFEWSPDKDSQNLSGYPILITCLSNKDEIIYPDFKCSDNFSYDETETIYSLLPYVGKISSGDEFTVKRRKYFDGSFYLEIAIDSCGDQKILQEALGATKEWIRSLEINPDIFEYETPDHYCPGGAA